MKMRLLSLAAASFLFIFGLGLVFTADADDLPGNSSGRTAKTFSWSIKGPPSEISLRPNQGIEIGFAVKEVPATNIRLMQASFIEQSTKTAIIDGWVLCETPDDSKCPEVFSIPANTVMRLWLLPNGKASVVGKYNSTVIIGSSEKPDGETLTIAISGTSTCLQWLGALAILVGLILAWVVNNLLQSVLNRRQLQLPLKELADRVAETTGRLEKFAAWEAHTGNTRRALEELDGQLSMSSLDRKGLLPAAIPNPFQTTSASLEAYRQFLAARSDKVAWLQILVSRGFEPLFSMIRPGAAAGVTKAGDEAADALDALSDKSAPPQPDPMTTINPLLEQVRAAQAAAIGPVLESTAAGPARRPDAPLSYEQLTVEIRQISLVVWGIFMVLAASLGSYVVILSNPGFGLATDFLLCFFWGLGVPTGAQQLSQSTAGTAGAALGINIPSKHN